MLKKTENTLMKEMPVLDLGEDDTTGTLARQSPISGVGTMRLFLQVPFQVNILSYIQEIFSLR